VRWNEMNKKVDEEFRHIHNEYLLQCTCTEMKDKINNLQSKIDKAIEILNKLCIYGYGQVNCRPIKNTTKQEVYNAMYEIKNVLKEVENVKNN
jgi:uncharacterized protein YdaT